MCWRISGEGHAVNRNILNVLYFSGKFGHMSAQTLLPFKRGLAPPSAENSGSVIVTIKLMLKLSLARELERSNCQRTTVFFWSIC